MQGTACTIQPEADTCVPIFEILQLATAFTQSVPPIPYAEA